MYLSLSCGKTPVAIGQIFWRTTHPFSTFLSGSLISLLLVRPLACRLLPALVSFSFLRCMLPVGRCFLTGFRLASYRGVEVGCESPHLRSISPNFPDGFCILLLFYASTTLQGGLVSWYPLSPLQLRRRGSFEEEE